MNEPTDVSLAGSTVLIVEDDPQTLELLQVYMEDLPEVHTVTATNGEQALETVHREMPDLLD